MANQLKANGGVDAQFVHDFMAKFGADLGNTLTPQQMIDLSLAWASFWVRVRTRSVISTARDDFRHATWATTDYITKRYRAIVQLNNEIVHQPNMAGDLMLAPVTAIVNGDGDPALQTVFEKVYRLSREDALDLLRYAQEETASKLPTDAAKLFSHMANWLDEFFSWRNNVSSTIRAKSQTKALRSDIANLDPQVDTAIGVMCRLINEFKTSGADTARVNRNWATLNQSLGPINRTITSLTNAHALHTDAKWRNDTVRKAARSFPTKTAVEMQTPPWLPSMLHLRPQARTQVFQQPPQQPPKQPQQLPQFPPQFPPQQQPIYNFPQNTGFANNPYQQSTNNLFPPNTGFPSNLYQQQPPTNFPPFTDFNQAYTQYSKFGAQGPNPGFDPNPPIYGGAGKKRTRTKTSDEGQLKRSHWSGDLEPQDFEPLAFKKRKVDDI
ncbi:hypothetical protein PG993_011257 [Apiospora rasikravindrae]|uniref:Uncharacterized protein n=1 Tax=Apiospora rasikravindrae TaxID=990691 RepID=A0ABR1SDN3_9PEZI